MTHHSNDNRPFLKLLWLSASARQASFSSHGCELPRRVILPKQNCAMRREDRCGTPTRAAGGTRDMGVDLRMEPYAEMYQAESLESRILDEFYFQNVDGLFESLGLTWDDYSAVD